jgi:hypothetical protein
MVTFRADGWKGFAIALAVCCYSAAIARDPRRCRASTWVSNNVANARTGVQAGPQRSRRA